MKPFVLIILDGWGVAPPGKGNAITSAGVPVMDRLAREYPSTQLEASGPGVGLPPNEDGNSEVGHLNLGSGRIVYQELPRINIQIADGDFFQNSALISACTHARQFQSTLHLIGLIGSGTVHSSLEHLYALLKLANLQHLPATRVKLHLFTDGRDSPPDFGLKAVREVQKRIDKYGVGEIATISGRYYAMDRNNQWDRTQLAYEAMVLGKGVLAPSEKDAIEHAYEQGKTDEFIPPTVITNPDGSPKGTIHENDAVIFSNFRADRARQLTKAFVLNDFELFPRGEKIKNLYFATMTQYEKELPVSAVAYSHDDITMSLAEVISHHNLKQFHIAETEKYAHVTYFFNGRREDPFPGEDRLLIPSPSVATYDLKPEMSATELTDAVIEKLNEDTYSFIVMNYANADMVSHSGNFEATMQAVRHLDGCIGRVVEAVRAHDGTVMITADHGNAEEKKQSWFHKTQLTKHSTNPVPLIIVSEELKQQGRTLSKGVLGDVAPTILYFLDIPQPMEMTGRVLIR